MMTNPATAVPIAKENETPERLTYPQRPRWQAVGLALLNWLIPGAGYAAVGDFLRAGILCLIINLIFAIGLYLDGYLYVPSFRLGPEFNIVAILTLAVQALHGGGTILLLAAAEVGGPLGALLVRDPGAPYSDLGAFHLLVAGGLNYVASARLYDLLVGYEEPKPASKNRTTTVNSTFENPAIHHASSTESNKEEQK